MASARPIGICDIRRATDDEEVVGGPQNWCSGFLPATFQGTAFRPEGAPILDLNPQKTVGPRQELSNLDLIRDLNRHYSPDKADDTELEARTSSYELAYRMQAATPEAVDLSQESEATKKFYGMDEEITWRYGTNCLLARRLVERGVRFIELYCGTGSKWDARTQIEENHTKLCKISEKTVAGPLADLKSRGLLDSTLVIWGGEFGRTPFNESGDGPDQQIAGAERPIHVHDLHATIMHLMGPDHLRVTFVHNGRSERATVTDAELVKEVLA